MDDFKIDSDESSDPITIRESQEVSDIKPPKSAGQDAGKARSKPQGRKGNAGGEQAGPGRRSAALQGRRGTGLSRMRSGIMNFMGAKSDKDPTEGNVSGSSDSSGLYENIEDKVLESASMRSKNEDSSQNSQADSCESYEKEEEDDLEKEAPRRLHMDQIERIASHDILKYYEKYFNAHEVYSHQKHLEQCCEKPEPSGTDIQVLPEKVQKYERVWDAYFDEIYDLLYIYKAQIGLRDKVVSNKQETDDGQARRLPRAFSKQQTGTKKLIDLKLTLQCWNLDDRVLQDKEHSQTPQWELPTMVTTEECQAEGMETLDYINFIQNMYCQYTQMLKNGTKIHFFNGKRGLSFYDASKKAFDQRQMLLPENFDTKTFRAILHYQDIKLGSNVENILILNYNHEKIVDNEYNKRDRDDSSDSEYNDFYEYNQYIELYQIDYFQMEKFQKEIKRDTLKLKANVTAHKFKDERLLTYYEAQDPRHADQKLMTIQRIADSQTYTVIFPTGLLLQMVSLNQMVIQSRIQLNLKPDETIIDSQYCISVDGLQHCFWLIDQKLQVWRCYGERNSNESNWTITKV